MAISKKMHRQFKGSSGVQAKKARRQVARLLSLVRRQSIGIGLAFLAMVFSPRSAEAQTWVNTTGDAGNWNNAHNWNPNVIPDSATADAVFTDVGSGNLFLLTGVQARSLTFNTTTGAYTFTSSSPQSLSSLQSITVGAANTAVQTINLANFAGASMQFTGTGSAALTIINGSAPSALPTLVIGPNTVIGTSGSGGITVGGTGRTAVSGSFSFTRPVTGGLTKTGPGFLILSGNGTNLGGPIALNGGTLQLNYSANTAIKFTNASALTSAGGDIEFVPHASTTVTQNTGGTSLTAGHTAVFRTLAGAAVTFGAGGFSRSAGATFDTSALSGTVLNVTTSTGNTNGLLGTGPAFATFDGSHWATVNAGQIVGFGGTGVFGAGTNTIIFGDTSVPTVTTNSLRFDTGNSAVMTLTGTLTLQSGGILVAGRGESTTITGGVLATAGELIVHQYTPGVLSIESRVSAPSGSGLTKTGPGLLSLGGILTNNFPINVNRGSLQLTTTAAVGSVTAINFNDDRIGPNGLQQFIVDLGNGVNGAIVPPIRFSAHSVVGTSANVLTTGLSLNSTVTLVGAISSAPGATTPILFTGAGDDSSGFRLTGVNTFTGTVLVAAGTLGISSNAALGNAANALVLNVTNGTAGGLEFLGNFINLARPVSISTITRIISNVGQSNTISGPVTGNSLIKDGPGTLVLTNAGNAGGREVRAGTLAVNADGIGTTGNYNLCDGATLAVTATAFLDSTRMLVFGSPFVPTPTPVRGTIDVAAGQVFTLAALVTERIDSGDGILVKTGTGRLDLTRPENLYGGGTVVEAGELRVIGNGSLGPATSPVRVEPLGALTFTNTTTTGRTFTLISGTVNIADGQSLTLSGATVGGGFLRGTGTYVLNGGTSLTGVTTATSTTLNATGPATLTNVTHNGNLTVATGQTVTMSNATNGAAGRMTVNGTANVTDFVSNGQLTIPAGGSVVNPSAASSGIVLGGGSTTFIGTPAAPGGVLNVGAQPMLVRGGLLVNNGAIGNNSGNGIVIVDYGGFAKGTGFYDTFPQTINGGRFSPGNSPGRVTVGSATLNPGGNYDFEINNATGTPGPTGTTNLSGWDLTLVNNQINVANSNLTVTATPQNPFTFNVNTLRNPSPPDVADVMANFNPNVAQRWLAFDVNPAGSVTNWDPTAVVVNTSQIVNLFPGTFTLERDTTNTFQFYLTYTPVPEPGTVLAAVGLAAVFAGTLRRLRKPNQ